MKPDEKYMMTPLRASTNEIKFKEFNPSDFIPNFKNNIAPVMFWQDIISDSYNNSFYENNLFYQDNHCDNRNATDYPKKKESSYLYSYNKDSNSSLNSMNIDAYNNNLEEVLRNLNSSIDENIDLPRICCDERINNIHKKILKDCDLISIFKAYKVPDPIINLILMKVIKSTLGYSHKGR